MKKFDNIKLQNYFRSYNIGKLSTLQAEDNAFCVFSYSGTEAEEAAYRTAHCIIEALTRYDPKEFPRRMFRFKEGYMREAFMKIRNVQDLSRLRFDSEGSLLPDLFKAVAVRAVMDHFNDYRPLIEDYICQSKEDLTPVPLEVLHIFTKFAYGDDRNALRAAEHAYYIYLAFLKQGSNYGSTMTLFEAFDTREKYLYEDDVMSFDPVAIRDAGNALNSLVCICDDELCRALNMKTGKRSHDRLSEVFASIAFNQAFTTDNMSKYNADTLLSMKEMSRGFTQNGMDPALFLWDGGCISKDDAKYLFTHAELTFMSNYILRNVLGTNQGANVFYPLETYGTASTEELHVIIDACTDPLLSLHQVFALYMTDILSVCMKKRAFPDFEMFASAYRESSAPAVPLSDYEEKYHKLVSENLDLQLRHGIITQARERDTLKMNEQAARILALEKEVSTLKHQNEQLMQGQTDEADELKQGITERDSLIDELMTEQDIEEKTSVLTDDDINIIKSIRIMFAGGRASCISKLKKLCPNARFTDSDSMNLPSPECTDFVVIFDHYISHPFFYTAVAFADSHNIPRCYSKRTSAEAVLKEVAWKYKTLEGVKNV